MNRLEKIQEMFQKLTTGETALALGALEANVELAIGQPGIPGAKIFENLITQSFQFRVQVQWTTNSKWAIEEAFGASLMGSRVLLGLEPKTFYEAFEQFKFLLQTKLQAGVVLILGDHHDTLESVRAAKPHFFNKIPLFEPTGPYEGREMLLEAFRLSETYQLPVMIRINHFFQQRKEMIATNSAGIAAEPIHLNREPLVFPVAPDTGEEHLKRSLSEIGQLFELSPFNRVEGEGPIGIIAVGMAYHKVIEVLDKNFKNKFCVLKLGTLFPIPQATIGYFLENVKTAIILEDNAPLIERQIQELVKFQGVKINILGRDSQHVGQEKILYHWQIEEILASIQPRFRPLKKFYSFQKITREKHGNRLCQKCNLTRTITHLVKVLHSQFNSNLPFIIRDDLCFEIPEIVEYPNTFAPYPGNMIIGLASGIARTQKDTTVIAIIEAASFIRNGINSLIHAAQLRTNLIIIMLENQYVEPQDNEQKYNINQELVPTTMPLENLISVCDVTQLKIIDKPDEEKLTAAWLEALKLSGLRIFIIKNSCPMVR